MSSSSSNAHPNEPSDEEGSQPARSAVPQHNYATSPLAAFREGRLVRRLIQLYAGLFVFGISVGLLVRAELGVTPWDVLHQGITVQTPLSFGTVVILASFVVLLTWIPLRQWPGLGTFSNAVVVGIVADAFLAVVDAPDAMLTRIAFLAAGIVGNGFATSAYIGARFGPGPRDGLMTGLVALTGRSIRLVRTCLEVIVVATGWLLGGTVGLGTLAFALAIGPLVHFLLPRLTVRGSHGGSVASAHD